MIKILLFTGLGISGTLLFVVVVLAAIVTIAALFVNPRTGADTNYGASALLAAPPPPLQEEITLKIVTYNIAAAYLFTANRPERIRAIARVLRELDPDIVGFQEAFIEEDRDLLVAELAESRLRHHAWYPSATVGNGLLTMSAYPIVESYFHRFQHSNPWYKIHQGDWWAGKGVGLARIALPDGGHVDFFNTHAQAGRGDEANHVARFGQMGELAAFMNNAKTGTAPAFIVGDFNTKIGRPDMDLAIAEAELQLLMTIASGIDFIFAAHSPHYSFEALETIEIRGTTEGGSGAVFLSRAPTPRELWRMWYGPGETTALSDHSGYLSTIRITPR